jgi:preprotein translocase subunit YajC
MTNLLLETAGGGYSFYLILGGMFILMMLLTILPQRKRQKQMREMMAGLKVGNRIKTIDRRIRRQNSIN